MKGEIPIYCNLIYVFGCRFRFLCIMCEKFMLCEKWSGFQLRMNCSWTCLYFSLDRDREEAFFKNSWYWRLIRTNIRHCVCLVRHSTARLRVGSLEIQKQWMCITYGSMEHLQCSACVTGWSGDAGLSYDKTYVHGAGIKVGPCISNWISIGLYPYRFWFLWGGGGSGAGAECWQSSAMCIWCTIAYWLY
jgi:hypothetical protein